MKRTQVIRRPKHLGDIIVNTKDGKVVKVGCVKRSSEKDEPMPPEIFMSEDGTPR